MKRPRSHPRKRTSFPHLWSVILAGGEGTRLNPFIKQWIGSEKPKQYCVLTGTRSMLQHTVDRADRLASRDRKIIVVARHHEREAVDQLKDRGGRVVLQPCNRDTVAGIFLPLTYVRAEDPEATVVIYPSDHFVYPEEGLIDTVSRAVVASRRLPDSLVLLGVQPDRVEPEYGWIWPSEALLSGNGYEVHRVGAFMEKPTPGMVRSVQQAEALWNTFVIVSRVDVLWRIGWRCVPSVMRLFEQLESAVGHAREAAVLDAIYRTMPVRNFSLDILQQAAKQVAVMKMEGVAWSDWGRVERIRESLRTIGKDLIAPPSTSVPEQRRDRTVQPTMGEAML